MADGVSVSHADSPDRGAGEVRGAVVSTMNTKNTDQIHSVDNFAHWFICPTCARDKGGTWPEGHCATVHYDNCPYCGRRGSLAGINDYTWDDGIKRGEWD